MDNDKKLSGEFILEKKESSDSQAPAVNENVSESTHHHPVFPDINKRRLHFLSSLCVDPDNLSIINQDHDETVHLLVRCHLITNIFWVLAVILLLFLPLIVPFLLPEFTFIQFSATTIISTLLLFYLSLFGYTLLKFAEWYFHVGLVSNKRIVDVDLANILSKNIAETDVKQVEDVSYVQKGIIQSVFNFGDVHIQTEAVLANFEFNRVPHPSQIAEIVSDLSLHFKKGDSHGKH
ncbi:MAG TPA: hypothetical protein PLD54_01245 [Candidatus Levybacteria bacterium]|nr:hypothetical protein [Candidatus Levybacteria bacterium]